MSKDSWIASGYFLKHTGKLLGNAQIPPSANRREGRIAQQLSKRMQQFPFIFSEALHFCLSIFKNQRNIEKLYKFSMTPIPIIFFHIIPLLARLREVRQSLK
jgi:hypothetical protein